MKYYLPALTFLMLSSPLMANEPPIKTHDDHESSLGHPLMTIDVDLETGIATVMEHEAPVAQSVADVQPVEAPINYESANPAESASFASRWWSATKSAFTGEAIKEARQGDQRNVFQRIGDGLYHFATEKIERPTVAPDAHVGDTHGAEPVVSQIATFQLAMGDDIVEPRAAVEPSVPAVVEAKPSWVLQASKPIHEQLSAWAKQSGWVLDWKMDKSWLVPADIAYTASFEEAISEVITGLYQEGHPVRLTLWSGNRYAEVVYVDSK